MAEHEVPLARRRRVNGAPGEHAAVAFADILGQLAGHEAEVDHAGRGRVERRGAARRRFEPRDVRRVDPGQARYSVLARPTLERVERADLGGSPGDDQLPRTPGRDAALLAVLV